MSLVLRDGPGLERIKVLVVDDDPIESRLIEATLYAEDEPHFDVVRAESLAEALDRLQDPEFDAVLLDLMLPDSADEATVDRLREAQPDLPLVVHTGRDDLPFAADVIRRGADDYLVKGDEGERGLARALLFAVARRTR